MNPPALVVTHVQVGVRPVELRLPFRFGAVTLKRCPQLFVRVELQIEGRAATGHAAEMMVPRWFDKRPGFSMQDNVLQLAASVQRAAGAYLNDRPVPAFGLFDRHYAALMDDGQRSGATALTAAYGQAVLDRAVLDAACNATGLSFFEAAACNLPGLCDSTTMPDLQGHDWPAWLGTLQPLRQVAARHTVGMLDGLSSLAEDDSQDGLPVSLPAVIARYGHRYFKIKLGGQPQADADRLAAVLEVLDARAPDYRFTLDGNEQYADGAALGALFDALQPVLDQGRPGQRRQALLYLEQPVARDRSLHEELPWAASPAPLLMDEADGRLADWPQGRPLGWTGVSSKSCKGFYKALINRARVQRCNQDAVRDGSPARFFMSAEDLTCQAGLSVQQDLALAALLGLAHAERNGHHYGPGFGSAPAQEQQAFASAHPDLYSGSPPRLHIHNGLLQLGSLFAPGLAHSAQPDWQAMQPLTDCSALV